MNLPIPCVWCGHQDSIHGAGTSSSGALPHQNSDVMICMAGVGPTMHSCSCVVSVAEWSRVMHRTPIQGILFETK